MHMHLYTHCFTVVYTNQGKVPLHTQLQDNVMYTCNHDTTSTLFTHIHIFILYIAWMHKSPWRLTYHVTGKLHWLSTLIFIPKRDYIPRVLIHLLFISFVDKSWL